MPIHSVRGSRRFGNAPAPRQVISNGSNLAATSATTRQISGVSVSCTSPKNLSVRCICCGRTQLISAAATRSLSIRSPAALDHARRHLDGNERANARHLGRLSVGRCQLTRYNCQLTTDNCLLHKQPRHIVAAFPFAADFAQTIGAHLELVAEPLEDRHWACLRSRSVLMVLAM